MVSWNFWVYLVMVSSCFIVGFWRTKASTTVDHRSIVDRRRIGWSTVLVEQFYRSMIDQCWQVCTNGFYTLVMVSILGFWLQVFLGDGFSVCGVFFWISFTVV
jgi:hypothetical protein